MISFASKVVKDLTRHGFNLQKIRRCLKPLEQESSRMMRAAGSLKYLTDGEQLFVITDNRQQILAAMERQFVLSLGIGSLVRELDRQVRRIPPTKVIKKSRRTDGRFASA